MLLVDEHAAARAEVSDAAPSAPETDWFTVLRAARLTGSPFACGLPAGLRLQDVDFPTLVGVLDGVGASVPAQVVLRAYQDWIAAHAGRSPHLFAAWFNLGTVLAAQGSKADAAVAYGNALALKPDFHPAAINLGLCQEGLGQPDAALRTWQAALQPDEARTALLNSRARLMEGMGRLQEAEAELRASLLTDPAQPDAIQHWVHLRQKMCLWPVLPADMPGLPVRALRAASGPLGTLALTDDVEEQRQVTADWIARKTSAVPERLSPPQGYGHGRIRIGYLSSDFCSHAMAYLITELLERHDRARFEVYGYCMSPEDGSAVRARILAALDHHRPIRHLDDAGAARLIRGDEIDVLVDLNGLTSGARPQILRWKPAPIQATYLGFIGPVPVPEIDLLFCDDFVIPPGQAGAYLPRPLPVARIYQANDAARSLGRPLTRQEAGLPDDKFVFCSFTNHYKITEEVFAAWMAVLRGAGDSVLWLAEDNRWSSANLLARAGAEGIAEDRIVFAARTGPDLYMSRLALADLYLDTFPYNAGTVASDAIRMGLPLLTLQGRSFASRMAARLLDAVGAAEGIAGSLPDYVARAVRFATDPAAHARYRAAFGPAAWAATIGDAARFTAEYEATLAGLVEQLPRL